MTATQQAASGSSLITALEATWAAIRRRNPDLPEVVFITGTGLRSASAASVDAKWGHFGAQRWARTASSASKPIGSRSCSSPGSALPKVPSTR